jgi:hypothetical protein
MGITNRTTILVEKTTRDVLKQLGSKGQSYDNLINWLISTNTRQINWNTLTEKNSLDDRSANPRSRESS